LSSPAEKQLIMVETAMRSAASPAYKACRWPEQDAENRRWIDNVTKLLTVHEAALADRLERLFAAKWAGLPFRVDVVDRANGTGATTLNTNPPGAHILVSSANPNNQGAAALEIVFHEASHFLTGRGMPLSPTLAAAQRAVAAVRGDYTHQVHFFLTGEAVRQEYARVGDAQYTPLLFALQLFSDRFRSVVQKRLPVRYRHVSGQPNTTLRRLSGAADGEHERADDSRSRGPDQSRPECQVGP
jgi:hypothetical protein